MKNLFAALFVFALSSLFLLDAQSAQSGFVPNFDKDKYKTVANLSDAYEIGYETFDEEKHIYSEVYCASNFHYIQGNVFIDLSLPGNDNWAGSDHCDVKLFSNGSYIFADYSEGVSIPDEMPPFANIKAYYHFVYGKWIDIFIDGWELLDDVRKVGQDYIAADNLKIRSKPSLKSEKIDLLKKEQLARILEIGRKAAIDGIESALVKVRTQDGKEGWCFAGYLTDGKEYRKKRQTSAAQHNQRQKSSAAY